MATCITDSPTWQNAPINVKLAMLAGAAMEGGICGEGGVGDNGCSHGPYQMNTCGGAGTGLPVSCLVDAECATRNMITSYTACAGRYSNPVDIAYCAERPAHYYGASQIQAAMAAINRFFNGIQVSPPSGQTGPSGEAPALPGAGSASGEAAPGGSGGGSGSGGSTAGCLAKCGPLAINPVAYAACVAACKQGGGIGVPDPTKPLRTFADMFEAIKTLIEKLFDPETYERIGIGVLGFILILIGAGVLAWNLAGGSETVIKLAKAAV